MFRKSNINKLVEENRGKEVQMIMRMSFFLSGKREVKFFWIVMTPKLQTLLNGKQLISS